MDHAAILGELEQLVAETYTLWDEEWVGFTWRTYTFEHVQRVRGLAQTLARATGADELVLAYAALLHDITKGYDGEIVMKDGQRVLDEKGRWRNQVLLPARRNHVIEIYERLGLAGSLHNQSGAVLADALLAERGLPDSLRSHVALVIRSHLRPHPEGTIEEHVLYDADTIDANIGLPALHRNLYINLHREEGARPDFADWIGPRRAEFYRWWLGERVPLWISTRRPEFVPRLSAAAARALAEERYDRKLGFVAALAAEIDRRQEGDGLSVLDALIDDRVNPRLSVQLAGLRARVDGRSGTAAALVAAMETEMRGLA